MKKAVVIFSGGQDSTTCLYWALQNFDYVEAITFFYGQNHRVELKSAKAICEKEKIKQTVVDLNFLNTLIESAMLNGGDTSKITEKGLPSSFVPNRNQIFITLSHAYAQKIGAQNLVTGVCQTDYSGYPDCRNAFIQKLQGVTNEGSSANIMIHTPLMWIDKAQTWAMAAGLGRLFEIIELSHTCYLGDHYSKHEWGYGCGHCPACQLRAKGWEEFKLIDPAAAFNTVQ